MGDAEDKLASAIAPAYTHLYVDPDAPKAADVERQQMPRHFFARGIPDRGGCEYSPPSRWRPMRAPGR